jgi:hypothetical protein
MNYKKIKIVKSNVKEAENSLKSFLQKNKEILVEEFIVNFPFKIENISVLDDMRIENKFTITTGEIDSDKDREILYPDALIDINSTNSETGLFIYNNDTVFISNDLKEVLVLADAGRNDQIYRLRQK